MCPIPSDKIDSSRFVRAHFAALLIVTIAGILFFTPLLIQPTKLLYSPNSDLLTLHTPRKQLLVSSWQQTGQLPLWNPYEFCGAPFVHDIQVATFYPPHAILFSLNEGQVGSALSWLVVAHVVLAGWCMYVFASYEGLKPNAALISAFGYMFAGKWLLHMVWLGHYILIGMAWFPLLLLLMSLAIRRRSILLATLAGCVFALMILGTQPQWTFYAGLFAACWTIIPALERAGYFTNEAKPQRNLAPWLAVWLAVGMWVVVVGIALTAVQLLPTLESAKYSTRAVEGIQDEGLLTRMFVTTVKLIGPGVFDPRALPAFHEFRGNVGLLWGLAAVAAPWLCGRKERWQFALVLIFTGLAVGGLDVLQIASGISLFRLPSRMMIIVALPMALLAGKTSQALFAGANRNRGSTRRCRLFVIGFLLFAAVCVLVDYSMMSKARGDAGLHPYWIVMLAALPLAAWLVARTNRNRLIWRTAWTSVLLADAVALSWLLVDVRTSAEVFQSAACVDFLAQHTGSDHARVLDFDSEAFNQRSSPLGNIQPMLHQIHTMRGYNPLGVHRYREFVEVISEEQIPFLVGFSSIKIANKSLLDMAGTKYLLQPTAPQDAPRQDLPIPADPNWQAVFTDSQPRVYVFSGTGISDVESYTVYENLDEPLARAYFVSHAVDPPSPEALRAALKTNDFKQQLLLDFEDDYQRSAREHDFADAQAGAQSPNTASYVPAEIRSHEANQVVINVQCDAPGWLVLTDVWFPGWQCEVDGESVPVHRANYVFRAVRVPAGSHEVEFSFRPRSYALGRTISQASLAAVALILALAGCWDVRRRRSDG